jgi:adenosine deaminase
MGAAGSPLPKAELHVHIEGTLEAELAFELAERNGIELPYRDPAELRSAYRFTDLGSFLKLYTELAVVLRTERDFAELTEAYLTRAAAQGVRHAEVFFDPQGHLARGVPIEVVVDGVAGALESAPERHGITTGLILCFLRDQGADAAREVFEIARPHLHRMSAVGLASAERGHPPAPFAEVYELAARAGLRRVAHAGEEGPADYVWQALDVLKAERIDHGVRSLEDDRLVERLVAEQIPLTVCPLSNVLLGVVPSIAEHPLPAMLERGLMVTVNSDDPGFFGGYVEDNFDALNLSADQRRRLARNSFEAAFLDQETRRRYLAELDCAE